MNWTKLLKSFGMGIGFVCFWGVAIACTILIGLYYPVITIVVAAVIFLVYATWWFYYNYYYDM